MERLRGEAAPPPSPRAHREFELAMARLTDPQRVAVELPSVPLCIVAGAGSGKTSVLTLRVAHRIRQGLAAADHTVVATFTRKAAGELRDRLHSYGVPVSTAGPGRIPTAGVRAGTVHQLALTLIRRHCLDTGAELPTVIDHRSGILRHLCEDPATAAVLSGEIGWAKARGLGPGDYASAATSGRRHMPIDADVVVEGFRSYQAALAQRHGLDLDDLLIRAADLLTGDEGFAERMRWRYRHLSVDEFQDVNPAQFRLIRTLLGDTRDLCVVGDPHQAIYGWNGADPSLLDRLGELLGPITVLELADNHRSTPQIVAMADAALGHHRRYQSHSLVADGPQPNVVAYDDEWEEAAGVAAALVERHDEGVPWSEQAVLARTHDQLSTIARTLERSGIPHRRTPAPEAPPTRSGRNDGNAVPDARPVDDKAGSNEIQVADRILDAVELATFHRAKGAEWLAVCVTGLEEGFVPIVYAIDDDAWAEERRLLYVALTRAGRSLVCSWSRRRTTANGRVVERQPSPWLNGTLAAPMAMGDKGGRPGVDPVASRFAGLRAELHGNR
ncbi:MAG: ATP-dependent helicase [Acidimicrobiales bacterium]